MAFDVTDLLENLFGGTVPTAVAAYPVATVEVAQPAEPADPLLADGFADWVLRPDCGGRMGWEAPKLPEIDRWWARCDFDRLPEVPPGFRFGDIPKPKPQDCACCVSGGRVGMLDPGDTRPMQAALAGFPGV